jgi:hypothetical protein
VPFGNNGKSVREKGGSPIEVVRGKVSGERLYDLLIPIVTGAFFPVVKWVYKILS